MTPPFDTRQVRHAFGRAAASYEAHAVLQHEVERRLLERLDYVEAAAARALDLGCGPGRAAQAMRARWKSAQVIALDAALPMLNRIKPGWLRPVARVNADARALPLAEASVDVLFSNLCIQWIDDLPALFEEFRRVLRPGGLLLLNLPAHEWLRSAHDARVHTARRYSRAGVRALLEGAGFAAVEARHWNSLLLPLMAVQRKLLAKDEGAASDVTDYPPWLDRALFAATQAEGALSGMGLRFPAGGSVMALARR